MDRLELAKWLHDNYEAIAKDKDWNTQENCKVDFDTLPPQNKLTMLELADRILKFDLLRLYFVRQSLPSDVYTELDIDKAYKCGERQSTFYKKNGTVILPRNYEGIDG